MKKLERKWARICFALLAAGLGLAVAPWALHVLLGVVSEVYPLVFSILAAVCLLAEFLLSRKMLRCPTCGKTTAPPRWDGKTRFRCVKCGMIFPFDDQPEIPVSAPDDGEDEGEWEEEDADEADEDEEILPVKEDE